MFVYKLVFVMWNHFSFISVHNLEMDNPFLAKIPLMDFERTPPIFNCVFKKKTRNLKKKPRCYIFDFKPLYKSANYLWCCTSSLETEYLVMFSSGSHVNWYCWTVKLHVFLFFIFFRKVGEISLPGNHVLKKTYDFLSTWTAHELILI